jgi:hypothetical protein
MIKTYLTCIKRLIIVIAALAIGLMPYIVSSPAAFAGGGGPGGTVGLSGTTPDVGWGGAAPDVSPAPIAEHDTAIEEDGEAADSENSSTPAFAAIGGLSGFLPCSVGNWGWLIANLVVAGIVVLIFRGRDRRLHWYAVVLLALLIVVSLVWAGDCQFTPTWLPVIISIIAWLTLRLGDSSPRQQQAKF